ncbi:MAG: BatA domain-containing protein, partial [Chthoniobacteraceae bacterium]
MVSSLELYGFRFASPWLLLALLLIPLWIWIRGRVGQVASVQYSSAKLLEAAAHRRPKFRPSGFLILMRYSAIALLILALARPQLESSFEDRQALAIDIVFNLDFSSTMA